MGHSDSLYRTLFQQSRDAVFIVDETGNIRESNEALRQLLGHSEHSLSQLKVIDLVAEPAQLTALIVALQRDGSVRDFPVPVKHHDGRVLEVNLSVTVTLDDAGEIQNYLGILRDITEQKRMEAILAESNMAIQARAESISIINSVTDVLYRSLSFETVVNQATDLIMNYANAPVANLLRHNAETDELTQIVARGLPDPAFTAAHVLPVNQCLSGTAVTRRQIVATTDFSQVEQATANLRVLLGENDLNSVISIPLLYQEQVLGVINLFFREKLELAASKNDTLLAIGKTIALAMANAEYVSEVEEQIRVRQRVEQELREQERRQKQLRLQLEESLRLSGRQLEISRVLTEAGNEQAIWDALVNRVDHYEHVAVSLTMLETEGEALVDVVVAQNEYSSNLELAELGARHNHSELPLAAHYAADQEFCAADMGQDERIPEPLRAAFKQSGIRSMAILPLAVGGNWLGNLTLMSANIDFFNDETLAVYRLLAEQGAVALRGIRLYEEAQSSLARREREVSVSTQISQEIASAADLSDLYQRVVNQIQEEFGYYHTQLLRYDPAMETVALTVGYGKVGEEMLGLNHSVPVGVGLIGLAAGSGRSILRPDLTSDTDWQPNPLLPAAKGELAVPIKLGDVVLGVLDVESDNIGQLEENDQLILEGLCGQIAVAIESTTLREDMEARLSELNVLQRRMSREGWQEYQMVRQKASGYQFDHGGIQPVTRNVTTATAETQTNGSTTNGSGANGETANGRTATDIIVGNNPPLNTPLQVRGEVIGTLGVQESDEKPLTEDDQDFLDAVSKEIAEALESARLFEQTQDALAEQERLTSELETVAQVSAAASTILEVDALLQAVVDLSKSSFDLYHVHIYLVSDNSRKLMLKSGAGNVGRLMALEGREINLDADSLVARAARSRTGVLENNVRKTVDFLPHPLLPLTKSELAVPMIIGEKLIGVLDLQSDRMDNFAPEDLDIQRTLASQISIAVENARQYALQVETSAKLRELDQLKSEFLASMSHELRTPLNSIIGFADVLLEGLDGELNERMEEDVHLIRESGRHLRELIGEILDMSKIEAGRMELRYEEIDLRQLAGDIVATAQPLAAEKSLEMFLDVGKRVSPVQADRTRLRQVLWNIMGNAIKFTEVGSVTLSLHDQGDNVLIAIRDTGIGIKEEDIGIVFEQFRQIDGGLNRSVGGSGLGMPITRKLVEIHGGDIWVESSYGQGSTFFFTIPYDPPIEVVESGPTDETRIK